MTIEVFFSYSHKDEELKNELEKQLSILKRTGVIDSWRDRQITDNSEWDGEIDDHLNSAQIILLLVSPDFVASDYCWNLEVKRAIDRHEKSCASVIPVILRPTDSWQQTPFGKLQALPKNGLPVTAWEENQQEAFADIAAGIAEEILALNKRLQGDNHLYIAQNLNNLANLYSLQKRYDQAESLYLEALKLSKQLLGEKHPEVATCMNNLATLYRKQGRYDEAQPLYLEALELRQDILGKDNPDYATSVHNLAVLYDCQQRYDEAEPLYLEALELRKTILGEDHPDVATSLNDLALLYYSQEQYEEAEPLYQQALEIRKTILGYNSPEVAQTLNNLAALYSAQERHQEAEPLYQEALNIASQTLGSEHSKTVVIRENLEGQRSNLLWRMLKWYLIFQVLYELFT